MKLAHAGDNGLSRFLVCVSLESRVFLRQLGKRDAHFFLTGLRFRLDRHADDGLGEFHGLQHDGVLRVAERIAGRGIFQADDRRDIPRINAFEILAVVRVHLKDAAHALVVILGGIVNRIPRVHRAGIHAEETELSDVGVGRDLEGERRKRLVVGRMAVFLFPGVRVRPLDVRDIRRGGHIIDNGVQKLLHALIPVRRTTGNRNHAVGKCGFANTIFDFLLGQLLPVQVFFKKSVILLCNMLDQRGVVFLGQLLHVIRNLFAADVLPELVVIDVGLHLHQVDQSLVSVFFADGELNRHCIAFQTIFHHLDHMEEISPHDVHFIDIGHAGNVIFLRLAPNGLGLRFNAALSAENGYGAVEHTKGAFHLDRKVNVAGSVNDVDSVTLPKAGGSSRGDRDSSFLLLRHPVHRCSAIMNFANFMVNSCIIQNTFCGSCFTGINMCHNADIAGHL